MGALYLQQSVCILPELEALLATLQKITERIAEHGGNYHLLPLNELSQEEETKIIDGFIAQSNLQYDEIIENCDVNFSKEIEFETFRQNFTYAEAEEIGQELEKIGRSVSASYRTRLVRCCTAGGSEKKHRTLCKTARGV